MLRNITTSTTFILNNLTLDKKTNPEAFKAYYSCSYCDPFKYTCFFLLTVLGIPFNLCVIYTLLASPALRSNFVSINLVVITCINIVMFLSQDVLFYNDIKQSRENSSHLYLKIKLACIVLEGATRHWVECVFNMLRALKLLQSKSCRLLYYRSTTLSLCIVVFLLVTVWYIINILDKTDLSKQMEEPIILMVYNNAARLEIALVMIIVPGGIVLILTYTVLTMFRRGACGTRLSAKSLHSKIVTNMQRFALLQTAEYFTLVFPMGVFLIYLRDFSENVPLKHQQIAVLIIIFLFDTSAMMSAYKYRVVWGLFQMELDSNIKYIWSFCRRKKRAMVEIIKRRAHTLAELMKNMPRPRSIDTILTEGTLFGSDDYDPVLDMFMNRSEIENRPRVKKTRRTLGSIIRQRKSSLLSRKSTSASRKSINAQRKSTDMTRKSTHIPIEIVDDARKETRVTVATSASWVHLAQ